MLLINNVLFVINYLICLFTDVFINEMYTSICELAEKHLETINEIDYDYRSSLINLKLINSLSYKIIPVITKSSTNWRQSYLLINTISQMLSYVDKCNKVCINYFIYSFLSYFV